MIRHYEKIGLIPHPARREGGFRDYGKADVHHLRFIARARDLGFPIARIGPSRRLANCSRSGPIASGRASMALERARAAPFRAPRAQSGRTIQRLTARPA